MSFFPDVPKIAFEGPKCTNPFAFRHYDAAEVVEGKTMTEHFRFAVAYWHTMRGSGSDPFGPGCAVRPWEDGTDSVAMAQKRVQVAFEFMEKLGVPYYCFHDRDVAPEGKTLAESNANLDAVVKVLQGEQDRTGIKLLWGTANLFSNPRFVHGASTSCNADVFAYGAAQVKKAMEVTKRLGGENYVFWGGREGYSNLYNTDLKRELDHFAKFLHLAVNYKKKIGFTGQFLIEPMCAWNRSLGSKLSRRTLASKLNPPAPRPPCSSTTSMTCVVRYRLVGNWSVSQPMSSSPRLASMLPSRPLMRAYSSSCIIVWPASVAWFVSMFNLKSWMRP